MLAWKEEGKNPISRPNIKNLGCENNLYTIYIEGFARDSFEKILDKDKYVDVYKAIVENKMLNSEEDLIQLLFFIALTIARNPKTKEIFWPDFVEKWGNRNLTDIEENLYPMFIQHHTDFWFYELYNGQITFVTPEDNSQYLICCDFPVSFEWRRNGEGPGLYEITMPLSFNLGVHWSKRKSPSVICRSKFLNSDRVNVFNHKTFRSFTRFVYFPPDMMEDDIEPIIEIMEIPWDSSGLFD